MAKFYGSNYSPQGVMSIHGILSNGKWQTILKESASELNLPHFEFKYGYTFNPWKTDKLVRKFREWYFEVVNDPTNNFDIEKPFYRPSIVAHSLGTWIVAKAMETFPEIMFDKIFLHGAIIPEDFDWYSIILRDQLRKVINEKSAKDGVVPWSGFVTGSFSPCSRRGFVQKSTFLKDEDVTEFHHSDFQYSAHFKELFKKHLFDIPIQIKVDDGEGMDLPLMYKCFKESWIIDREVYGLQYVQGNPLTIEIAKQWVLIEKNIWSFMFETFNNKVVGYLNTVAVDDETMEKYLAGTIGEDEIMPENICNYSFGNKLNIIVMSIAISKDFRELYGGFLQSKPGELLILALSTKLLRITNGGKRLNRIACIAWTPMGKSLCKAFGLKDTGIKNKGHAIYCSTVKDIKDINSSDVHALSSWYINQIRKN